MVTNCIRSSKISIKCQHLSGDLRSFFPAPRTRCRICCSASALHSVAPLLAPLCARCSAKLHFNCALKANAAKCKQFQLNARQTKPENCLQCFKRAFLLRIRYTFKLKNGEKITKKNAKKGREKNIPMQICLLTLTTWAFNGFSASNFSRKLETFQLPGPSPLISSWQKFAASWAHITKALARTQKMGGWVVLVCIPWDSRFRIQDPGSKGASCAIALFTYLKCSSCRCSS